MQNGKKKPFTQFPFRNITRVSGQRETQLISHYPFQSNQMKNAKSLQVPVPIGRRWMENRKSNPSLIIYFKMLQSVSGHGNLISIFLFQDMKLEKGEPILLLYLEENFHNGNGSCNVFLIFRMTSPNEKWEKQQALPDFDSGLSIYSICARTSTPNPNQDRKGYRVQISSITDSYKKKELFSH